jgi:hypothetical protein
VLRLLAANRTPASHVAGGTVLNASPESPRFSRDVDIFHDVAEAVARSAEADVVTLRTHGFAVRWLEQLPTFFRAVASREGDAVKLEWAYDSAWRYFPVVADPLMGWRLHEADLATNKVLALAGRSETRDLLDLVRLDETFLPLEAMVWAACGKDAGFTPGLLLDQMSRNARIDPPVLEAISAQAVSPVDLKRRWLELHARATEAIQKRERDIPGCFFLDPAGTLTWPAESERCRRHEPRLGGAWPTVEEEAGRP